MAVSSTRRWLAKIRSSDIALIQIQNPKNLTAIKMSDSDALRDGELHRSDCNPFGLGETVTSGLSLRWGVAA